MHRPKVILLFLLVMAVPTAMSVEWNGRVGIGARPALWAPLIKGDQYTAPAGRTSIEPFMMGPGGIMEFKYGIGKGLVLGFSAGYWYTYDDTLADEDQSFKLAEKDNATTKIKVIPLGLTGQFYFIPASNVQPYLLVGVGADLTTVEDLSAKKSYSLRDFSGKAGAGFNFWMGESVALDIGARFSYLLANLSGDVSGISAASPMADATDSKKRPYLATVEPGVTLTVFLTGPKDTDKDGVKDKFDQCPDTPAKAIVDKFGCPVDSDGDGVYDGIDQCPETPRGALVDIAGCPLDSDRDGVFDGLDRCPDSPLGVPVDENGCPLDSDGDGVPDFRDQQPETPRGAKVDQMGVAIDSDGDGVPDGIDKCANTPIGIAVDDFGCPLAKPLSEKMVLHITYEANSVEPDESAKRQLDELVLSLKAYPDVKIEINGYTDALGSARTNLKISQARAEAIKNYLQAKGIAAERMVARGFGEDSNYFIADNETPEGRARNRRIEIVPTR